MSDSEAGAFQLVVLVCNFMSVRLWDRICWAEDGPGLLHTRDLSHGTCFRIIRESEKSVRDSSFESEVHEKKFPGWTALEGAVNPTTTHLLHP